MRHDGDSAPVAATLLSVTQADASGGPQLCVRLQGDETSIARGQTAQWNVSVWSTGGTVSNVKLSLAVSPAGQKAAFSFGCPKNGTNSCAFSSVNSDTRQLQARVPVPKTATFKSVKLTVTGAGTGVSTKPTASVPIAVTAPKASASVPASSPAASSAAGAPGSPSQGGVTTVPQPSGVTSPLPVGGLPFLNSGGSTLNPGGNASSLFPTLNPSGGAGNLPTVPSQGSPRTRPLAQTLPADASLMGAQYAGLGALALAFILSVTRLSIRRRQAAKPGSGGST